MTFAGINYVTVLAAAVAGFIFGSVWYGVLSKQWLAAVGTGGPFKPSIPVFVVTFVCQFVMALMLAGVVWHLGDVTVARAMISAGFLWVGFVITTMIVNHRFQGAKWSLTVIDGLHWLGVLLVMGVVIGLIGV